jgi:hypothetical protein
MNRYIFSFCIFGLTFLNPESVYAKCVFRADADFLKKNFELEMYFKGRESVRLNLNVLPSDKFSLTAKLNHFKLFNSYLSSDLTSEGLIIRDGNGGWKSFRGLIQTNYSLLNLKPFKELKGSFEFDRSSVEIESLLWGNLRIAGQLKFGIPYSVNLTVDVIDMDINELAVFLGVDLTDLSISGLVSGRVNIEGEIPNPRITGELRLMDGNIGELKYSEILVNIMGIYPVLKFVDSNIFEKDGYTYSLTGRFNMQELGNLTSPSHDVRMIPLVDDDFGWQAWKIRRKSMYGQDDLLEFEYKLKENRPFKMRLREDEEIFSLEHSLKF